MANMLTSPAASAPLGGLPQTQQAPQAGQQQFGQQQNYGAAPSQESSAQSATPYNSTPYSPNQTPYTGAGFGQVSSQIFGTQNPAQMTPRAPGAAPTGQDLNASNYEQLMKSIGMPLNAATTQPGQAPIENNLNASNYDDLMRSIGMPTPVMPTQTNLGSPDLNRLGVMYGTASPVATNPMTTSVMPQVMPGMPAKPVMPPMRPPMMPPMMQPAMQRQMLREKTRGLPPDLRRMVRQNQNMSEESRLAYDPNYKFSSSYSPGRTTPYPYGTRII